MIGRATYSEIANKCFLQNFGLAAHEDTVSSEDLSLTIDY